MTDENSHRVFAALYDPVMTVVERRFLRDERRKLVEGVEGRVLELGAGTGAMFAHYPSDAVVHAVEPDTHMLRRARRRATEASAELNLVRGVGESLPYEDSTFDYAVSPIVLCTVGDLSETLGEVRRLLRDDGELLFLEHVHDDGFVGSTQNLVNPLWRRVAGGCNLNRETMTTVREFFDEVEYERVGGAGLVRPFVRGSAKR